MCPRPKLRRPSRKSYGAREQALVITQCSRLECVGARLLFAVAAATRAVIGLGSVPCSMFGTDRESALEVRYAVTSSRFPTGRVFPLLQRDPRLLSGKSAVCWRTT